MMPETTLDLVKDKTLDIVQVVLKWAKCQSDIGQWYWTGLIWTFIDIEVDSILEMSVYIKYEMHLPRAVWHWIGVCQ